MKMKNLAKFVLIWTFLPCIAGCAALINKTMDATGREFTRTLVLTSPTFATSSTVVLSVTATSTPETSATPSKRPTRTTTPSRTPRPSPTETLTATQIPMIAEVLIPVCPGEGEVKIPPANFGINGTLLYQDGKGMGLYTLGGTPYRQTRQLVDATQEVVVLGFSPNGRWLDYVTVERVPERSPGMETPTMVLLSDTGERIERPIDLSEYYDALKECCPFSDRFGVWQGHWLNNQLLYLEIHSSDSTASGMVSALPAIYDPFAGNWYKWFEELPDRYEIGAFRLKGDEIGLSPDLSRVLYPARSGGIIMRDIPNNIRLM